jgi:hypothetical protein
VGFYTSARKGIQIQRMFLATIIVFSPGLSPTPLARVGMNLYSTNKLNKPSLSDGHELCNYSPMRRCITMKPCRIVARIKPAGIYLVLILNTRAMNVKK